MTTDIYDMKSGEEEILACNKKSGEQNSEQHSSKY